MFLHRMISSVSAIRCRNAEAPLPFQNETWLEQKCRLRPFSGPGYGKKFVAGASV